VFPTGLIVILVIFAAAGSLAIILRFPPSQRLLIAVFVVYLWLIPAFALIYHALYRFNPLNFVFAQDIAHGRRTEVLEQKTRDRDTLLASASGLDELARTLAQRRQDLAFTRGGLWDVSAITGPTYEFEIGMGYFWVLAKDSHIYCENYVDFRLRGAGGSPRREILVLHGPRNDDPARERKIEAILAARHPSFYRELVLRRLKERRTEIERISTEIAAINSVQTRIWRYGDFLYFSTITQASVGYGDILPNSTAVRTVVTIQVLCGVALLTVAIAVFANRVGRP
jgi:Ion channel